MFAHLIGVVLAVNGIALFTMAISLARFGFRFRSGAKRARGVVVGHDVAVDHKGVKTYLPVIEFLAEGRKIEFRAQTTGSTPLAIGRPVAVIYRPEQPELAEAGGLVGRFLFPVLFGAFGGLCLMLAAMFLAPGRPSSISPEVNINMANPPVQKSKSR